MSGEAYVYSHSLVELAEEMERMKIYVYDPHESNTAWSDMERAEKSKVKRIVSMLEKDGQELSVVRARRHLCRLYNIPEEVVPDDHEEACHK